jgi:hypothetical protein
VTTHNAFNYDGPFLFPNQSFDVAQQLQDGVRGLMLDVYWLNNQVTLYHGSSFLGTQPLVDVLIDIRDFLQANPSEVVSIIFEADVTATQMNDVFIQSGILSYAHQQVAGQPWPTLQDMIANDKRLVVFSDVDDGQAYPWYHYVWDHAVETHFSANSRADFDCAFNRGVPTNSLFILNHFVTAPTLGTGILDSAAAVNSNPYFSGRAMDCWVATGKMPNFLTVDFYEQGNVMAVKDAINSGTVGLQPSKQSGSVMCMPNPVQIDFKVKLPKEATGLVTMRILDPKGVVVLVEQWQYNFEERQITLPQSSASGIYTANFTTESGTWHTILVVMN